MNTKTVRLYKAQPIGDQVIPDVEIKIRTALPDFEDHFEWVEVIQNNALLLCDALFESLPGGVLDHLLAEMMKRKASSLKVSAS